MKETLQIVSLFILTWPTIYEWYDDRKGETLEEKRKDVKVRALLIINISLISIFLKHFADGDFHTVIPFYELGHVLINILVDYLKAVLLSTAFFIAFFDYGMNLILGRKPWYSYFSKSPNDLKKRKFHWGWIMAWKTFVLIASLIFYFI